MVEAVVLTETEIDAEFVPDGVIEFVAVDEDELSPDRVIELD